MSGDERVKGRGLVAVADSTTLVAPTSVGRSDGPAFDRTPPQDIEAEMSVLGGMLLSKDAIADVIEVLRGGDFYRPAHQLIYDAILDLYGRGEPADAVTVAAELSRAGQIGRIGGHPYLHTLISGVPTAANAGYYAEIVAERAILRRLVEAGTRIVQMGYGAADGQGMAGTVDDVVDRAQAEVYEVTERRTSEDYVSLEALLEGALDDMARIEESGGRAAGIPTGFAHLDEITHGLHPGQMVVVAGRPGSGKALALNTPLATPTGWTTMGNVRVGDQLLGADGRPTRVVAATEVMTGRPCFEVEFSDGTVIVADAEHQWRTTTRAARRAPARRLATQCSASKGGSGRLFLAAARVQLGDGELITARGLIAELGDEFRIAVHAEVRHANVIGRVPRPVRGPQRSYQWTAPAYSKRQLLAKVFARSSRERSENRDGTVTTTEIAATLRCATADKRLNHAVMCTAPLALPEADLLVPPYTLGAWLGHGTSQQSNITTIDSGIIDRIRQDGFEVTEVAGQYRYSITKPRPVIEHRECEMCGLEFTPLQPQIRTCSRRCGPQAPWHIGSRTVQGRCTRCGVATWSSDGLCGSCGADASTLKGLLRSIGVLGKKHIPAAYLRASESQRRALLAGLLDTDGTVNKSGNIAFSVTDRRLADDFRELVVSLGYRASMCTEPVNGRTEDSSTCYTIAFTASDRVFSLSRKADRQVSATRAGTRSRYIVDVRPVESVPVRCVQVDNDEHMYLAGRAMVPTHNSTLAMDFARSAAIKNGRATVIFSLEMSKQDIMMRLFSAEARVKLNDIRGGRLNDEDWRRIALKSSELAEAPLFIDDSPNLTMMEIRAKARRLKQRHDLKLIVIDYMQLMTSGKRVESRQQEVSEFSRAMKLLAKEIEVPVVALSQLNRGPETRTDKRPMLSDLRESGSIEQDADVVLLVHREDMYERESPRAGEADIIIAKHRNGPTGLATVAFQGHLSRFVDMPS
jgi:replicative DNA helicase